MVENQLRPSKVNDESVLAAMGAVPRETFVPKKMSGVAYADDDLALPGGKRLIEPLVLARMIQAARLSDDEVALVIGCDTGYCAAVLARLAATVFLQTADEDSRTLAEGILDGLDIDNVVTFIDPDPAHGHPGQAPFDVVLVIGRINEVPAGLLEQIGDSGRLIAVVDDDRVGRCTVFRKFDGVLGKRQLFDAAIPPLPGLDQPAGFQL